MSMSNFKKVFLLTLGFALFFACSQDRNRLEPKRTVIAGVINNFSDEVVLINYCDNFRVLLKTPYFSPFYYRAFFLKIL
jgi:hypothetical protein